MVEKSSHYQKFFFSVTRSLYRGGQVPKSPKSPRPEGPHELKKSVELGTLGTFVDTFPGHSVINLCILVTSYH